MSRDERWAPAPDASPVGAFFERMAAEGHSIVFSVGDAALAADGPGVGLSGPTPGPNHAKNGDAA